jgi:hypothetical protein
MFMRFCNLLGSGKYDSSEFLTRRECCLCLCVPKLMTSLGYLHICCLIRVSQNLVGLWVQRKKISLIDERLSTSLFFAPVSCSLTHEFLRRGGDIPCTNMQITQNSQHNFWTLYLSYLRKSKFWTSILVSC